MTAWTQKGIAETLLTNRQASSVAVPSLLGRRCQLVQTRLTWCLSSRPQGKRKHLHCLVLSNLGSTHPPLGLVQCETLSICYQGSHAEGSIWLTAIPGIPDIWKQVWVQLGV